MVYSCFVANIFSWAGSSISVSLATVNVWVPSASRLVKFTNTLLYVGAADMELKNLGSRNHVYPYEKPRKHIHTVVF